MAEKSSDAAPSGPTHAELRQARLEEQLRENLKKRKALKRARDESSEAIRDQDLPKGPQTRKPAPQRESD